MPCDGITFPTVGSAYNFCSSPTPTIADLTAKVGGSVSWYNALTGGTQLAPTSPLVSGTTYYAETGIGNCTSSDQRTAVKVTLGSCSAAPSNGDISTFTNVMYDFQYQTLEAYNSGDLGDFYQWVRVPDGHEHIVWRKGTDRVDSILPMIGGADNTSETIAGPTSSNGNYTRWNNEVGPNFDQVLADASEEGKFITYSGNWSSTDIGSNHRWSSYKTANDPCPQYWQVPSRRQQYDIYKGDGSDTPSYGNYSDATDNDWIWRAATNNAIGGAVITNTTTKAMVFLPAAGVRLAASGALSVIGTYGYYWSSARSTFTGSYTLGSTAVECLPVASSASTTAPTGFLCVAYRHLICRCKSLNNTVRRDCGSFAAMTELIGIVAFAAMTGCNLG